MTDRPDLGEQRYAASKRTRDATLDLARSAGILTLYRAAYLGGPDTVPDIDPLAGVDYSRQVEQAARRQALDYIRAAREARYSWHDIGSALGLVPNLGRDLRQASDTGARAAFAYAADSRVAGQASRDNRSISWYCNSCDHTITDQGPGNGSVGNDNEHGHASNCSRQAAMSARLPPEWDLDREAGQ